MKLAITQSNLTLKGGAERIVLKIAQHYKAPIYTAEYDIKSTFKEYEKLDVRVISKQRLQLPYGRASQGIGYGRAFYGLDLNDEFDVINAHMAPSHWASNRNKNMVWYCHTPLRDVYDLYHYRMSMRKWYVRPFYAGALGAIRIIDRHMVGKIGHIIANSSNTQGRISKYYNRPNVPIINGGIDVAKYKNRGDEHYFLYPSRISPNKRQDFAIEAFNLFLKKNKNKNYRLVIFGAVSRDKAFDKYLRDIIAMAKNCSGKIDIIQNGSDEELIDLYSRCTAVLYPPMNEDFGLVPLEAMASGKPVVAINEGGPKETVLDNSGFLIKSTNEMALAMGRLTNLELANKIGKNGRNRVVENYSWKIFFRKFDRIVKQAAKGSNK